MRYIPGVACLITGALLTSAAAQIPPLVPAMQSRGGGLKIAAHESTLADVLRKAAALTGAKIDIPKEAENEKITTFEAGPTTARQLIELLLTDSNFDYLIQGSDVDPDQVKSVLLFARDKKPGGMSRGPVPASIADRPIVEAAVAGTDPGTQAEGAGLVVVSPPATSPDPTGDSQVQSPTQLNPSQTNPSQTSNIPKTMPVPVPAVMSQPNIVQQLQQMYQQRVQMQQATTAVSPAPAVKQ